MSKPPELPDKILRPEIDSTLHEVFEQRVKETLKGIENEVANHGHLTLGWLTLLLIVLLGLNGFISYQMWRQSQQIDTLTEHLVPAVQGQNNKP